MAVHLIDAASVTSFVNNTEVFHHLISRYFKEVDTNRTGLLTLAEFQPFIQSLNILDMDAEFGVPLPMTPQEVAERCSPIFDLFDTNHDGFVDEKEFGLQIKEMFLGIAHGLGQTSVHIIVNDSSILKDVVALSQGSQV